MLNSQETKGTNATMLTTSDIAAKIGVTRQTVFNWIKSKKLRALKIGGTWRVWPEDLAAFLANSPNNSDEDASVDNGGDD